jgi:hypothetical protein
MKRTLVHATLSIAVGTLALACGGTKDNATKGSGSTGGSSSSGTGGTSGNGSGNGGSSAAGAGGGAITGCDPAPCTGKRVYGQDLGSCCMDTTTCGVQPPPQAGVGTQCLALSTIANLPAEAPDGGLGGLLGPPETIVLDPTCPDFMGMGMGTGGMALKGCCDKSGICGAALTQANQCFTAADIAGLLGPRGGGFDAGPQKACTYPK